MNPQAATATPLDKREKRLGRMETRLRDWDVRLGELRGRVDKAGPAEQARYKDRVEDLSSKLNVATTRVQALRAAAEDDWKTAESGLDHAWTDLELAFKKLKE